MSDLINSKLRELIMVFLRMNNSKRLESILGDSNFVIYDVSSQVGLYCDNYIIVYNMDIDRIMLDNDNTFFILRNDINTLESNILFNKLLVQNNTFKEELISVLEKEIMTS